MRELLTWKTVAWVLATIILPAVISAYGPEIRRLLDVWRSKPHQWGLAQLKYKLSLLERLHNSAYNLLLHFIWSFVWVFQFLLGYALLFGIVRLFKPNFVFTLPGMALSALSAIIGRGLGLTEIVYALYDYDKETAKLRAKIEKLENRTAKAARGAVG